MLRFFKNQNPYTVIILLIIAIVLKLPFTSNEIIPVAETNQVLWQIILDRLFIIFGKSTFIFGLISVINIVLQSLYLNQIVNNYHFYNKRTYLPAYTFLLVSLLMPKWSSFNLETFNNWGFLLMLNLIYQTYTDNNTRKVLFNIGFIFGSLVVFDLPNVWFFFFTGLSIAILRNFKPAEWMVTLLGMVTPFYLFISIAYLTDSLYLFSKVFATTFSLKFKFTQIDFIALGVLLFFVLIGFVVLSKQFNRMLFQIKKMWWINILFLIFSILSTIGIYYQGNKIWTICLIPASMIICKIWSIEKPKWFAELMNLILVGAIIYINFIIK